MKIERLSDTFPIYLIKNFCEVENDLREKLCSVVLECKKRNHFDSEGKCYDGSFLVDKDYNNFFRNLYNNFHNLCYKMFDDYNPLPIRKYIFSYSTNKDNCGEIPGRIHNHVKTSTINSVFYLNVPSTITIEKGSISFFMNDEIFTYKPNNDDFLIFPDYLDHGINNYKDDEEWRISINMEIICSESSDELFNKVKI